MLLYNKTTPNSFPDSAQQSKRTNKTSVDKRPCFPIALLHTEIAERKRKHVQKGLQSIPNVAIAQKVNRIENEISCEGGGEERGWPSQNSYSNMNGILYDPF